MSRRPDHLHSLTSDPLLTILIVYSPRAARAISSVHLVNLKPRSGGFPRDVINLLCVPG